MSNLLTRAISGTIFVIILVSGILYNQWSLKILFLVISALGLIEFYKIVGVKKLNYASVLVGICTYLVFSQIIRSPINEIALIALASITSLIIELFHVDGSFQKGALRITGIIYIIVPFSLIGQFDLDAENNAWIVLSMFIMIWANDTGAYLSGRTLGKNKLFERISPKKTVEGLIGGGIMAIVASLILSYFVDVLSMKHYIMMSLIVFVFANIGDLVESMMKRNFNIKDSGNIIPGHGGILDRFDAVLLTIPVVYLFLRLI